MNKTDKIKDLTDKGNVEEALELCDELISSTEYMEKDYIYYLKGNIYRKCENWQKAMDNYQYAIDINPKSPAITARKMVIDILNYYYKDQFNQ